MGPLSIMWSGIEEGIHTYVLLQTCNNLFYHIFALPAFNVGRLPTIISFNVHNSLFRPAVICSEHCGIDVGTKSSNSHLTAQCVLQFTRHFTQAPAQKCMLLGHDGNVTPTHHKHASFHIRDGETRRWFFFLHGKADSCTRSDLSHLFQQLQSSTQEPALSLEKIQHLFNYKL